MRYYLFLLILLFTAVSLQAQQLQLNTPDPLLHGANCDIHSTPGIAGDSYYVLCNDFGRKKGSKDPVDAYLKIYSIEKGTLIRSINLNDQESADRKEQHILFTNVFLWKGHLLGLYAGWKTDGTWLNLYGQFFDENGNKLGGPALLETISLLAAGENKKDKVPQINDNSVLGLSGDIHYTFNRDSSSVALYYTGDTWKNFELALLGTGLESIRKWKTDFAANSQLLQCLPHEKDGIYALVVKIPESEKTPPAYQLLAFRQPGGDLPVSIPLALPGKIIQGAGFHMDNEDNLLVTGTYTLSEKATQLKSTYGVYALKIDPKGTLLHMDVRPFAGGMISDLAGYKAASRGKGLGEVIGVNQIIPLPGTGMASVGQNFVQGTENTVYPMTMSPHYDASGEVIMTGIAASGEVKWISYLKRYYENFPSTGTPTPFYATRDADGHLLVIYDENGEQQSRQQIFVDRYGDNGIRDRDWLSLPRSFDTRSTWILWKTACQVDYNTIMVAYYNPWKKWMGTLKIGLNKEAGFAATP